jgi:hypothetical protein
LLNLLTENQKILTLKNLSNDRCCKIHFVIYQLP